MDIKFYPTDRVTLRDYFAAQFLCMVRIMPTGTDADEVARNCYVIADAMLRAREGK